MVLFSYAPVTLTEGQGHLNFCQIALFNIAEFSYDHTDNKVERNWFINARLSQTFFL